MTNTTYLVKKAIVVATGVVVALTAACDSAPPAAPESSPGGVGVVLGSGCRAAVNGQPTDSGVLECASYPTDPDLLSREGSWSLVRESGLWRFCPIAASDLECGA
jgi:hypothetical protein